MAKIPLGMHGALRQRSDAQRQAVLSACKTMLDKGSDLIMREDIFWSDVQPTETGGYDWTIPDGITRAAADHGFRMFWVLSHPPVWATAAGAPDANYSWPCPPYPDIVTAGGNNALAAYATFCGAAAARYAEGGAFWETYSGRDRPAIQFEIWNEEYGGSSKRWVISTLVDQYSRADLYAQIYDAAAAAIWGVPYALPVASLTDKTWNSAPEPGGPYLDTFLATVTRPLGGASIHPYTNQYVPASFSPVDNSFRWQFFTMVPDIRAKLDAAGHRAVDIHITEIGWPSRPTYLTEEQQAGRFTDLWATVQNLNYIKLLILFTTTNPDFPDNPALPGYSADNQEVYYAFWHTGSTNFDIGGAKPVVTTVTSLPALTSGESVDTARTETFFTLAGPLLSLINDSDEDTGTNPDQRGMSGTVRIKMEIAKGQLLLAPGLNPPKALEVSEEIIATVTEDGDLTVNDGPLRLLACTNIFDLAEPFQYRINFDVYLRGNKRRINPFSFVAPDSDIIKRIAQLSPVPSKFPEGITKGDPGEPGPTLHWEEVVGGYQQFDDDGNSYGVVMEGLTLLDGSSVDGGTPESEDVVILDGGTP